MNGIDSQLRTLGAEHSVVGFVATVLFVGLRAYKLPVLQVYIPKRLQWATLTPGWQFAVTVMLSGIAGMLTALSSGKSGWELVAAAVSAIQDAIFSQK